MMKNIFLSILLVIGFGVLKAQTNYNMQNDTVTLACATGGVLFDAGGSASSYSNNQLFFFTVCPDDPTKSIAFDFNSASFGAGDYVCVYDGMDNTAPLIDCYNSVVPIQLNKIVRATTSNASGCLTFQFYSDNAITGDFEIELLCLAPCQEIIADIVSTSPPINPVDTTYIDLCFNDTLELNAQGIYTENGLNYNQTDASSSFYWEIGGLMDTAQNSKIFLTDADFYAIKLTIEDTLGCFSENEFNLTVRYIPRPTFEPVYDSILCLNETATFYDVISGDNIGGNVIIGDTVRTATDFQINSSAQYIPDDADGTAGNGITTPATYDLDVTGFIPGSTITNGMSDIIEICLKIEHSWIGDLDIVLVAPNGSQIHLMDMAPPNGPGDNFGTPVSGVNPNQPGVPETYCWAPLAGLAAIDNNSSFGGMVPPSTPIVPNTPNTPNNPFTPANDYQSAVAGNWNTFNGSAVNGMWTIQVFDDWGGDDGNIFGASFVFDSIFIPPDDSFYVAYDATGFWLSDPNIVSSPLDSNYVDYFAADAGSQALIYSTTSNFGCTESDTLNFFVDSFAVAVTPSDTAVCQGDPVQINTTVSGASGSLSYSWTPSSGLSNSSIANPIATLSTVPYEYVVSVTNSATNCVFTDTASVQIDSDFEFSAMGDTILCAGDSINLWAAGGALTYAWSPNDGSINDTTLASPTVFPSTTTTYTVKADSTGCSQYANITVSVSDISLLINNITNPSCGTANGVFFMFPLGGIGSSYTYSIDGGVTFQNSGSFSGLGGGTYIRVVSDGTSCDYIDTVVLTGGLPLVIDSVYVLDPSCGALGTIDAVLSVPNTSVTYTLDVGPVSQDSSIFNNLSGGTYTISISDGVCPSVDTTITLANSGSMTLTVDSTTNLSCFNESPLTGAIYLSASSTNPPITYSIDGQNYFNSGTFNALDTGTYTVYATDLGGCIDSTIVTISQPDSLQIINIVVDSVACNGGDTIISFDALGGTAPYQYSYQNLTNFGAANSFTVSAGNYSLQIQDNNNCLSEIHLDTVYEPTALNLVLDSVFNANCGLPDGSVYVSASGGTMPYSYSWSDGVSIVSTTEDLTLAAAATYTLTLTDANGCSTTINGSILNNTPVVLTLVSADSISCFGSDDATIEVAASLGPQPYTFSLDGGLGQADSLFYNVNGGNHNIVVTDANGCVSSTLMVNIFEPTQLDLTEVHVNLNCDESMDGQITFDVSNTGTSPYTYGLNSYTTTQSSNIFSSLDAGSYYAVVEDNNGCRDTLTSITLTQPDTLIITNVAATDISCNGANDGSFDITVSGGTIPYSYNLNGGTNQTSNIFNSLSGGIYTINVTDDNNCPTATTIDSILEPTAIVIVIDSTNDVTCFNGNDGNINATVSGGIAPYTYSWSNGTTVVGANEDLLNTVAGTYTLTVTDGSANSCTLTSSAIIISQAAEITFTSSSSPVSCAGSSDGIVYINAISGGTAPFTAVLNNSITIPFTNVVAFNNLQGGVYHSLEVIDANGCHSSVINIFVNTPDSLKISLDALTDESCSGDEDGTINLNAAGGTPTYVFTLNNNGTLVNSNSGNMAVFDNLAGGQYPIYLTDANLCQDTIIIDISSAIPLFIDSMVIQGEVSCFGEDNAAIIVHPSGGNPFASPSEPYLYLWSPSGSTGHKAGALAPGIHTVTVTDANGCSVSSTQTIATVDPVLANILPDSAYISMGDTLQLNVNVQNGIGTNYQYAWSPANGLSCTDCENPIVTIYNDITYSVVVTDENGCTNYNNAEVFIGVNPSLFFFIPNSFTPNGDGLNDVFEVLGQDIKTVSMMIFNRWGEKVFEGKNQFQSWDGTYNGVMQNDGVFTYSIEVTFLNDAKVDRKGSLTLIK